MFDDIVSAALEWFGITGGDDLPDAAWGSDEGIGFAAQGEGMGIDG